MFSKICQHFGAFLEHRDELYSSYIALCVLNALSGIFATVFNLLVLLVIKRSSSLQTPSYVLLGALAFSDFAVGCVVQPLYIAFRVAELTGSSTVYCGLGIAYDLFGNCFGGLSFLIITSISVDRFLALYFRQRYRVVVTRKRTLVLTLVLSLIAAAYGLTGIHNRKAYYVLGIILGPLFLVLTSLNYININRLIRRHNQRRFRLTSQQSSQSYGKVKHELDMARYKHTLKTVMYVFFVFLLCYLPYISCTLAKLIVKTRSAAIQISVHATVTVIFINSSLNPALYCWRVPEIRKAVRQILRLDKQLVVNSSDATQQLKTCTEVKAESGPVYIINCSKTIVGISTVSLKE